MILSSLTKTLVSPCYFVYSTMVMEEIASILGKSEDAEKYAKLNAKIKEAFDNSPKLTNLLLDPFFKESVEKCHQSLRNVLSAAMINGVPVPAFATALSYYDGYRCERLPANLLQAQRDYFGAHTYERIDRPRGEFFHTNWTGQGGDVTARRGCECAV